MTVENKSRLPYIVLPEHGIKMLIDTGSSKSFISKKVAAKRFKHLFQDDLLEIRTAHGSSVESHSIVIPNPKIFKTKGTMKLHVFDFHPYFDALLGMDGLKEMNYTINFQNHTLENGNSKIPLKYRNTGTDVNSVYISSKSETIVELPVKGIIHGEIIVPEIRWKNNSFIPTGITTVKNNKFICVIVNPTEKEFEINLNEPFSEEFYQEVGKSTPSTMLNNFNTDKLQFDHSLLKTNHLNEEEKMNIENLVDEFSEIFYLESKRLTFSNTVKHKIRTTDEIPIFFKIVSLSGSS